MRGIVFSPSSPGSFDPGPHEVPFLTPQGLPEDPRGAFLSQPESSLP